MYTLKSKPEDFIVTEIIDLLILQEEGKFAVFKLTKKSLNTIQVVDMMTKHLRLRKGDIGFGGIKDRHAITTQYITVPIIVGKVSVKDVLTFALNGTSLEHVGYSHKAVATPNIVGNKFTITIRNWSEYTLNPVSKMMNFFGEQRFSHNNADIGYAFVKKDFKKAVELMLAYSDDPDKRTYNEKLLLQSLEKDKNDYIGALRNLPGSTCKFFLHAYQSKLWNETVSTLLQKQNIECTSDESIFGAIPKEIPTAFPKKVPAIGYFYDEDDWSEEIQTVLAELFKRDKITERDFVIRQMSEITEPGAIRETIVPIDDFSVDEETDEKLVLSFTLNRGCYATIALRHLLTK